MKKLSMLSFFVMAFIAGLFGQEVITSGDSVNQMVISCDEIGLYSLGEAINICKSKGENWRLPTNKEMILSSNINPIKENSFYWTVGQEPTNSNSVYFGDFNSLDEKNVSFYGVSIRKDIWFTLIKDGNKSNVRCFYSE